MLISCYQRQGNSRILYLHNMINYLSFSKVEEYITKTMHIRDELQANGDIATSDFFVSMPSNWTTSGDAFRSPNASLMSRP